MNARPPERSTNRLALIGVMVTLLFMALFARLWTLQVMAAPRYQKEAIANSTRVVRVPAPRGLILDRTGKVLAGNSPSLAVAVPRDESSLHPGVLGRLGPVLGLTQSQLRSLLADPRYNPYQPIPVLVGAPMQAVTYLKEHAGAFPGVRVEVLSQRSYPSGPIAAQTLGYVGPISTTELAHLAKDGYSQNSTIGQSGLEAEYESYLRGQDGQEGLEVDAQGVTMGVRYRHPAQPGDNLVTSISASLQTTVEKDLAAEIHSLDGTVDPTTGRTLNPNSGAAVVLDPNNGSVLALASYPTYNPSVWNGGISTAAYQALTSTSSHDPLLNRAIDGLYTPGSTFKLATATAALDSGLISPYSVIDDPGYFNIPNCTGGCNFHNAGYEALGPLSISKAIGASDDVFFYTLGYRFWVDRGQFGPTPIQDTAAAYGLGQLTGIDLPGETQGRVDSPAVRAYLHSHYPKAFPNGTWYVGDNLEMAFGQGGTVITPIELATAYATFANGGTRYAPRIGQAVVSSSGKVVKSFPPVVKGHVNLPPSTRQAMLAGFESAVDQPYGTAYADFTGFPLSSFPVAGKTGTSSQVGHEPTSLFVSFAPANQPKYVVCVVIYQAGYGASGAAPVAAKILSYLMKHPVAPLKLK